MTIQQDKLYLTGLPSLQQRLTYLNGKQVDIEDLYQQNEEISKEGFLQVMEACSQLLIKAQDQERIVKCLRVLESLVREIVEHMLQYHTDKNLIHILATVAQFTDKCNFSLLTYLVQFKSINDLFQYDIERGLETTFRLFEAQPYLLKVWDCSFLFSQDIDSKLVSNQAQYLLRYLRHIVVPSNQSLRDDIQRTKNIENLEYLQSLRLNKEEEMLKQDYFKRLFPAGSGAVPKVIKSSHKTKTVHKGRVLSSYLKNKIDQVLEVMEENIFKHFSISGDEGSGKMSFIELLSDTFHASSHNNLIVVTLEETFDSKNLVGTYVCNESGEFVFKKGPLTVAAEQGLWLVLRHIEKAPSDLLTFLLPLVQENILQVTANMTIVPKLGFRIFSLCHSTNKTTEEIKPFMGHLNSVILDKLIDLTSSNMCQQREDFESDILPLLYPYTYSIKWLPKVLLDSVRVYLLQRFNVLKAQLLDFKPLSVRQIFRVFARTEAYLRVTYSQADLSDAEFYLSSNAKINILEDLIDIFLGYLYDKKLKHELVQDLVSSIWNQETSQSAQAILDPISVADHIISNTRTFGVNTHSCYFGRSQNMKRDEKEEESKDEDMMDEQNSTRKFVYTATTLRLMEQIAQCVNLNESSLLVGETGTGKTTSVQELAKLLNKKLHVFNMNQNTDSSDLLGGFKPVDLKFLLKPLYEKFLSLFKTEFKNLEKNKKFLDLTQKCYEENRVKEFIQCLNHGLNAVRGKKNFSNHVHLAEVETLVLEVSKRANKLENGGGFIFQFIEGTLIKSIKDGEWILLDEINLASESVLNRLATLIDGDYILLNERADIVETSRHQDFRLFLCMNPPYTSAGKKQLPWSLRSKLTEVYVPELDNQSDLWMIIDKNCSNQINEAQKRKILEFYISIRDQVQKQTKRGNIGLRNLSRSLSFMKSAINLKYPILKAIFDSLYTCFASHLDQNLQTFVSQKIFSLFEIRHMPQLAHASELSLTDKYMIVEQFIIPKGKHPNNKFDPKDFVTTKSFKKLLKQLAGVVAVSDYAVILQGPTSAGKTSTVQYLANITHNKVIRINNHMHTDIQEYLGSYVPDRDGGGKLVFQEGVLVEAVRNGYWVILDELNLAPSEVLEALNRLLDDNRELLIVETQKVIKAHPNFRIFATQNPTEGYGGRKELSEAFKNRFILINVHDVPLAELVEILIHKCQQPESRAKLMVDVMESLQIYRSQGSNLFSGKDSTITVRDLLKWANRMSEQSMTSTIHDLALEGFLVLGERSRNDQDKRFIKETIEKVCKVKIDERKFFDDYFNKNLLSKFGEIHLKLNLPKLIQTQQLKRLAVLIHKCLMNKEPVLLVGETGCGKTTLCQIFAALDQQNLFSINCHQNTETSDFIGCMRTRKNLKQSQEQFMIQYQELLEELGESVGDLEQYRAPQTLKGIIQAFSSLQKHIKTIPEISQEIQSKVTSLKTVRDDISCIFEWHDGILVEAMQQGGLLLIDEISLANDSVLERLNSVFEHDRTLVISEKSSKEAVKIVGAEKFRMVATMNPSGDFGKKELSPALRNRMTEIWVESYFQQEDLVGMYKTSGFPFTEVSQKIDLFLIIEQTAIDKLQSKISDKKDIQKLSLSIFNIIGYINFILAQKYFALQRKSLSIRDILSIIEFLQVTVDKVFNMDISAAFKHAVSLVIIDGLCLGIDVSGDKQKNEILEHCNSFIMKLDQLILENPSYQMIDYQKANFLETNDHIGVEPYALDKKIGEVYQTTYAFDAQTTKINLLKVLRAYQLNKPILIEGPPGVGKTSLVENLAKVSGRKLIRVNLSEQTDMMDLLGSEYPIASSNNEDEDDDIRFHWCDGVLLQAIKEGYWFLIDEMNLAQQSVLEGLNAILDHRRTVYIPELNQEFKCHPDFFVFACQNPSQSVTSVGGRKTLPKSFLNRFNKIFLEELTQNDYQCIIERQASKFDLNVNVLLDLSKYIELLIKSDTNSHQYNDEGDINMRDLSRFLALYRNFVTVDKVCSERSLLHAFRICYLQRLSSAKQTEALSKFFEVQNSLLNCQIIAKQDLNMAQVIRIDEIAGTLNFLNPLKPSSLELTPTYHESQNSTFNVSDFLDLRGKHSTQLQFIVDCIKSGLSILIVTDNPQRFVENIQTIAKVTGQKLNRIMLNDRSDTSQLLGCFEQTAPDIGQFMKDVSHLESITNSPLTLSMLQALKAKLRGNQQINQDDCPQGLHIPNFNKSSTSSSFNWVDSVLVKSLIQGEWTVFENANLCNPSILDRLNPLLEEGNHTLTINEQGLVEGDQLRVIRAHADFRALFVVSERSLRDQGRDVSRALKNRCLQIHIQYSSQQEEEAVASGLDVMAGENVIDSRHMQIRWDLGVVRSQVLKKAIDGRFQPVTVNGIGKRKNPEGEISDMVKDKVLGFNFIEEIQSYFEQEEISTQTKVAQKAYLHFLTNLVGPAHAQALLGFAQTKYPQLKNAVSYLLQNLQPVNSPYHDSYIPYKIHHSIQKLQSIDLNRLLINKHTHSFLTLLTQQQPFISTELLITLRDILRAIKNKDFNQIMSYRNIYNLMKGDCYDLSKVSFATENNQVMRILTDQINSKEPLHIEEVTKYGQSQAFNQALVKTWSNRVMELAQSPILFCVKNVTSNVSMVGLEALLTSFSILMMTEDKQITRITIDNHRQKLDPYLLQERMITPYAILVPNSLDIKQHQADIIMSLSNLYPALSMIKDTIKLIQKEKMNLPFDRRLTHISPLMCGFQGKHAELLRLRGLADLSDRYGQTELQIIERVMNSSRSARMRDLPSYLLCSSVFQSSIKKYMQLNGTLFYPSLASMLLYPDSQTPQMSAYLRQLVDQPPSYQLLNSAIVEGYKSRSDFNESLVQDLQLAIALIPHIFSHLEVTLRTLFLVPLETYRLNQRLGLERDHMAAQELFIGKQFRCLSEIERGQAGIKVAIEAIEEQIRLISRVNQAESEDKLQGLIVVVQEIGRKSSEIISMVGGSSDQENIKQSIKVLQAILNRAFDQYYLQFNHLLYPLFTVLLVFLRTLSTVVTPKNDALHALVDQILNGKQHNQAQTITLLKNNPSNHRLLELYLSYQLKNLNSKGAQSKQASRSLHTTVLDHFLHREVAKKLKEEQELANLDELVYKLPFKMKMQTLMEENKAIDERTAEDKAKLEKEALLEIERQFPSYYDEYQRVVFAGVSMEGDEEFGKAKKKEQDVKVEKILTELLNLHSDLEKRKDAFKRSIIKLRLGMLQEIYQVNQTHDDLFIPLHERDSRWLYEVDNYLREELTQQTLPSVMNVSEVRLASTFNFYHDPLPQEARLVFEPLSKIIKRADIILLEYESPILQDAIFLANYMLTNFSPKTAPLMKLLTGLELLLNKLEEWEVYASKSLNSCTNEMTLLKQLIIRYRKIQILSWRNLLQWRKTTMIHEDFKENFLRLAHTLERQIFDKQYYLSDNTKDQVEMKILGVLDLFMRDSSLGQFKARLHFLNLLKENFKLKFTTQFATSQQQKSKAYVRLQKTLNLLDFVTSYYSQFTAKLDSTLARLDAAAREKVKTLIDVSKWTVQKFSQVKNNIDKRHRQLNKACKDEEEMIMQNVAHLVLTSSRKKYVQKDEGLAGLQAEKSQLVSPLVDEESPVKFMRITSSNIVIQKMSLIEKRMLEPRWPDCMAVENMSSVLFERLKIVRDINKKHIQRRAFIDLLKYMKEQGLTHNFQSSILPTFLDTSIVSFKNKAITNGEDFKKYYFKAHELLLMLENASEAENAGSQHLRNIEIIRVRGFSQSLIQKILALNISMRGVKQTYTQLVNINSEVQSNLKEVEAQEVIVSLANSKIFAQISKQFASFIENIKQNLEVLNLVDNSIDTKVNFPAYIPQQLLTPVSLKDLVDTMKSLHLNLTSSLVLFKPRSLDLITSQALPQLQFLIDQASILYVSQEQEAVSSEVEQPLISKLQKRVQGLQKLCQLMVQETVAVMDERYQAQAKEKEEARQSAAHIGTGADSTVASVAADEETERIELNVKEYAEFAQKVLEQAVGKYGGEIALKAQKIFRYVCLNEGISSALIKEQLQIAAEFLQRITGLVKFIIENQYLYMRSLAKFSFISQRVFIYLIFEGFCGEDDKEDEKNQQEQQDEDDKFFENDGMGMGDGKGGKENVSKEIEHEEQLEGLKNYESDQEKPEDQKDDEKDENKDEKDDNDFEMKGDFDGEMEDKPGEEDQSQKEDEDEKSDEDDELDQVDDMLDNKLWNEQMKDMEEREQEEDEKEEGDKKQPPREIDLGQRDLDKENQIPQQEKDKELTAGDNDKQDENDDDKKDDKEMQQPEDKEEEGKDDEEQKDDDQEIDGNEVPLDRDPNVVEDVEDEPKEDDKDDEEMKSEGDEKSVVNEGEEDEDAEDSKSQEEGSDAFNDQDLNSEASNDDENEDDGYKRDVNDDMIDQDMQMPDEDDKKDQQTNVNKPKNANQNKEQQSKQQNQSNNTNNDQQTQFDVQGSDILYQLSNKLKEKQQQQQQDTKQQQQQPEKKNDQYNEIEQPNMANPEDAEQNNNDNQALENDQNEGDQAMEYEFDQNEVEQLQGRLATDQVKEATQLQVPNEENDQPMQQDEEDDTLKPQDKTKAEVNKQDAQHSKQKATEAKQDLLGEENKSSNQDPNDEDMVVEKGLDELQLIDQYSDYLQRRNQLLNTQVTHDKEGGSESLLPFTFQSDPSEPFDYALSRQRIREMFSQWQSQSALVSQSQQMLSKFKQETAHSAASLCEQLRIVLEPQLSQQLQGDFKTGKRLNMKKVISFIASHYRNDKIWLRRTLPSKRDYKILLAIDDTLSMKEGGLGFFSLEALSTISEALHRLEVGKVAVAAIRDRLELLQSFEEGSSQSNERMAFVMSQFNFQHSAPKSADQAMANFVRDANVLLDTQSLGTGDSLSLPFVIVLSDGRFNKNNVRQYLAEAREKKYLYIFVILDQAKKQQQSVEGSKKTASSDGSILSMKSVEKEEAGGIKLVPYLKDFPFDYYCIVRDVHQLPTALGSILVQWFSMVNNSGGK